MKEEVKAGILNAMQRGAKLQEAADSFINAGYNPSEVTAAVKEISGASDIINDSQFKTPYQASQPPQSTPNQLQSKDQFNYSSIQDNKSGTHQKDEGEIIKPEATKEVSLVSNDYPIQPTKSSKIKRIILFLIIFLIILGGMITVLTLFSSEILNFFSGGS